MLKQVYELKLNFLALLHEIYSIEFCFIFQYICSIMQHAVTLDKDKWFLWRFITAKVL